MAFVKRDYVGRYRLVELLSTTASNQVWLAMHTDTSETAAVKLLRDKALEKKHRIVRLRREYTIGNRFNHPNIIRVVASGQEQKIPFLAMEYFPSVTLKNLLRPDQDMGEHNRRITPKMIEEAVQGLIYMHSQGWIHCDVKPDNFLVNNDGHVKLIDFSIARRISGLMRWVDSLTYPASRKAQGTRGYMSPEQIRNENLDPRADIYAFGCLLFEVFAGRPPFIASTPDELLRLHMSTKAPHVQKFAPGATQADSLIKRMLAKKREDRPASMKKVLAALREMDFFQASNV